MAIAFISRPLVTRIAGCIAALVASTVFAGRAAALDYKFFFNQTPAYQIGTIHPDGSVTYSWYLEDGRTRLGNLWATSHRRAPKATICFV
jgi:hypothetical protein